MCGSWTRSPRGDGESGRSAPRLFGAKQISYLDVDDTVNQTYGYGRRGAAGFGCT
jgi:hypothetical protein